MSDQSTNAQQLTPEQDAFLTAMRGMLMESQLRETQIRADLIKTQRENEALRKAMSTFATSAASQGAPAFPPPPPPPEAAPPA